MPAALLLEKAERKNTRALCHVVGATLHAVTIARACIADVGNMDARALRARIFTRPVRENIFRLFQTRTIANNLRNISCYKPLITISFI